MCKLLICSTRPLCTWHASMGTHRRSTSSSVSSRARCSYWPDLRPGCQADVDGKDFFGNSALHFAARRGHGGRDINSVAFQDQAHPRAAAPGRRIPVAQGVCERLALVLRAGQDVAGWSPMHWAHSQGHGEVVATLAALGCRKLPPLFALSLLGQRSWQTLVFPLLHPRPSSFLSPSCPRPRPETHHRPRPSSTPPFSSSNLLSLASPLFHRLLPVSLLHLPEIRAGDVGQEVDGELRKHPDYEERVDRFFAGLNLSSFNTTYSPSQQGEQEQESAVIPPWGDRAIPGVPHWLEGGDAPAWLDPDEDTSMLPFGSQAESQPAPWCTQAGSGGNMEKLMGLLDDSGEF
eukprot:767309-Hanusia_phi.AAC.4